jgi:hypothetical protein
MSLTVLYIAFSFTVSMQLILGKLLERVALEIVAVPGSLVLVNSPVALVYNQEEIEGLLLERTSLLLITRLRDFRSNSLHLIS